MSANEEVCSVLDALGRRTRDGAIRDAHLSQILNYLVQTRSEVLKATYSKLALICGMNKRAVRENYMEGLIEFGIINVIVIGNEEHWKWVGIQALLKNNGGK